MRAILRTGRIEMRTAELLDAACSIGYAMLKNGAEISRVEDTARRICTAYGAEDMNVFALSSTIIITLTVGGETLTQTKRVGTISTNLGRVKLLNDLSREICAGLPGYDEIKAKIDKCAAAPTYPPAMSVFAYALISGAFAFFFGGGVRECIAATAAGILVRLVMLLLDRLGAAQVIETAASSVAASATYLAAQFMPLATDTVLISVLMNLVPGVALVNSIRDFAATDFMSGSARIVEALFCTAAIAAGVAVSLLWR